MRTRILQVFILLIVIAGAAPAVLAKHGGHDKAAWSLEDKLSMKAKFMTHHRAELGLDDTQLDRIRLIKNSALKSVIRQDAEIEVLKLDIWEKLYENPVDVPAVHKLIESKYKIKEARAKGLVQSFADLKSVLTAEQYAGMKELWKSKKS